MYVWIDLFHLLQGAYGAGGMFPAGEKFESNGVNGGDGGSDGGGREWGGDQSLEQRVVVALVEEERRRSYQSLFTLWVGWLEEMSFARQNHLGRFWAWYHHTGAPQYVTLEYITIPANAKQINY